MFFAKIQSIDGIYEDKHGKLWNILATSTIKFPTMYWSEFLNIDEALKTWGLAPHLPSKM